MGLKGFLRRRRGVAGIGTVWLSRRAPDALEVEATDEVENEARWLAGL